MRSACLALPMLAALLAGCAGTPVAAPPAPLALAQAQAADNWTSPLPWTPARPAADRAKGDWWRVFGDVELDALVARAERDSASIEGFAARLRQARAGSNLARAATLPRLDATGRIARQQTSANRPAGSYGARSSSTTQNDSALGLAASYELDLFDRIGNEIASADAGSAQFAADLANARLVLAADLAAGYFTLRQIDAEIEVVEQSIAAQSQAVDVLQARHDGGAASGLDLAQQQAQLDATRTQLDLLRRQRPLAEHALATLSGAPAGSLAIAPRADWAPAPPVVPLGLPSEVLQRRPDVAAAQAGVAAANAQIGIARAGFFPSLVLGANAGLDSRDLARLLDGPSLLWSLGANVAQTVFDGGRNQARLDAARAAHEAASAGYRQTVLRALQDVEDGLASLDALARAAASAEAASASAGRALAIAEARQAGGLATWLDVVAARQRLLDARRLSTQIRGQQLVTTAYLVKALGGGWRGEELALR
ncbi:efflux transporter outer membrane subunit [Derxia lacustris]|uniref:efflux transporter outer membrane subunit n=1 Tax=Derxia lacustris TaxID=764842 RepID=UPI001F25164E|nr:efflux transporter outer membrane subunit [Derxia lacustris]